MSFVAEHIIYLVQKVWIYQMQIERCKWTVVDYWKNFITAEHNHIFEVLPYSVPLAIIVVVSWVITHNYLYTYSQYLVDQLDLHR